MKNLWITLGVIGGIILLLFLYLNSSYNRAVKLDEETKARWADVNAQYQRRFDLIDNLVATVKGAANFEQTTLTQVIEARSKATGIQLNADNLTDEQLAKFQAAQNQLKGALSRLMVVAEQYPQLTATQNFRELQAQIEGTENRINMARENYNESVRFYNSHIRGFVTRIALSMAGGDFQVKKGFEAKTGAEDAPKVKF